jgi:hypothetical protein
MNHPSLRMTSLQEAAEQPSQPRENGPEVGAFYWTTSASGIVNPGRVEQDSISVQTSWGVCAPGPFNKDGVEAPLSSRPAGLGLIGMKLGHDISGRELSARLRVEDLGLLATKEDRLNDIMAEV